MMAIEKSARLAAGLLLSSLLLCGTAIADGTAPALNPEPGVWQQHQYSFAYLGFTSTYSCDGLADKLRTLLIAAGARSDVKSRPGACASGFGRPDKFARADLTFFSLTPSAAGGTAPPEAGKAAGTWRPVSITDRSPRSLSAGDCELVEQFRNSVLPLLTTRNVESHTTCIPHQISGSAIDLKFEAFTPLPKSPPASTHKDPAG